MVMDNYYLEELINELTARKTEILGEWKLNNKEAYEALNDWYDIPHNNYYWEDFLKISHCFRNPVNEDDAAFLAYYPNWLRILHQLQDKSNRLDAIAGALDIYTQKPN